MGKGVDSKSSRGINEELVTLLRNRGREFLTSIFYVMGAIRDI